MRNHQIKILLFILLVLLVKISSGQGFRGGSLNGSGQANLSTCATASNLAVGGSFDGAGAGVNSCSAASNIIASGGSYDGGSLVRNSACASLTTLSLSGGSYNGSSQANLSGCAAASNLAVGGSYDGSSTGVNSCTAPTLIVATGGSYDGTSTMRNSACAALTTLSLAGGSYNGSSQANLSGCAPASNLAVGGSYDGSSSGVNSCSAASNIVASGGSFDGGSTVRNSACAALINLVLSGGSFNGASQANLSGCAAASNLALGGSYDGASTGYNSCTAASNIVAAGGSFDGTSTRLINCISFSISSVSSTSTTCNLCNGTATVNVTGGSAPFSYSWSPGGSTSATATGLCNGPYSVAVTDALGNITYGNITITPGTTLVLATSSVTAVCGNANGSASVTASNGTAPYSYNWSSGSTNTTATGLSPGTYSVTVTDAGGCAITSNVTIGNISGPSASISAQIHVSCNGGSNGSATVTASSGTAPYTYSWSTSPIQTIATANNLSAGNYTVTVTDANSCIQTTSVTITDPSAISPSISSQTDVSCNGNSDGTITVNPSGGIIPYTYSWNTSPVQTTATANNLSAGGYTVTVTDANGCNVTTSSIITQPAVLSASSSNDSPVCYGSNVNITSAISGGTTAYLYSWSGPASFSSTDANPVVVSATTANGGTYFLTVTDAQGCTATVSTSVTVNICTTTLNLTLLIEGYYIGSGQMQPTVLNENVLAATGAETDTIYVLLHDISNPATVSDSVGAILMTDGSATAVFNGTATGNSYWIAIRHRNTVETWSNSPVLFTPVTNYDFTSSAIQAYGSNMIQVDFSPDLWAVYNGDINQDQNVDLLDFPDMDYGINNGLFGYYNTDLNGDGNVDLLDFPVLDANINNGIYSSHP